MRQSLQRRSHRFVVAVLLLLSAALSVITATVVAAPLDTADPRAAIALTAVQRARLDAEMRAHLDAVHAVVAALAAGDWDGVAAAALRRNAAGGKDQPGSDFRRRLPPVWFRMAGPMNRSLDAIVEEARGQRRTSAALSELGRATEYCSACHATFRIVTEPTQ